MKIFWGVYWVAVVLKRCVYICWTWLRCFQYKSQLLWLAEESSPSQNENTSSKCLPLMAVQQSLGCCVGLFHVFPCFLDIFCVSLIIELSACSLYLLFHCLINLDRWRALKKRTLLLFLKFGVPFKRGIKQSSWLEVLLCFTFVRPLLFLSLRPR